MIGKLLKRAFLLVLIVVVAIQFVPYGRDHENPAVVAEPKWDAPRTRELARRACYDCHSNETKWPWYSKVAPVSWLVQDHVDEGRRELNFSDAEKPNPHFKKAAHEVEEGEMPLSSYIRLHPEADLSDAEKTELINGLKATFQN